MSGGARLLVFSLIGSALIVEQRADAQNQGSVARPKLSQAADTNDWEAYYDYAVSIIDKLPDAADTALFWATRLDPTRADPLFARWTAFWLKDISRFKDWLEDRVRSRDSAPVHWADTVLNRAMHRNPFVPRTLILYALDKLPGRWGGDLGTQGMMAYARLDYARAADYFGRLIRRNPERNVEWRAYRALAFVGAENYDSARVEMAALAAAARARVSQQSSSWYESLEMTEYGIGMLEMAQGRMGPAREAFERSLQENLGFFPAHVMLGDIALAAGNATQGIREFSQAAELAPDEAWIQYRFAVALMRVGRRREAIAPLQRAIKLAPLFADSYASLGDALVGTGDSTGAIAAYDAYVRQAPRRMAPRIEQAQRRLATLRAGH